jgi:CubicO group peptidase (beta-lactamase class C family)
MSRGFGFADIENNRKVSHETLFRMGSINKMLVALGILQLVEEGKLSLNAQLKDIASEVPFENPWEDTHPIRIVDLLEQTTGFDDVKLNSMYDLSNREYKGLDAVLEQKNCLVARWRPSERHAYSNPNYTILGYIIEKLTGLPYHEYLTKSILKPLDMNNSNFNTYSKIPEKESKEYLYTDGKCRETAIVTLKSGPVGALYSTSDDMLRFLQMFLRNGAPLYNDSILTRMETPTVGLDAKTGIPFGYGLANQTNFIFHKFPMNGHDGRMGNIRSSLYYSRQLGFGFVIATNTNYSNIKIEQLIVNYLQKDLNAAPIRTIPLDLKTLEPYLGYYEFASVRNEIGALKDKFLGFSKLYIENNKLYFKPLLGQPFELKATSATTFTAENANMSFASLVKNHEGELGFTAFTQYHRKVNGSLGWFKRLSLIAAVLIASSSIFMGIVALLLAALGVMKWKKAIPRIVPGLGIGLLLWSVLTLLDAQAATYKLCYLASITPMSFIIFFGTTAFGIATLTTAYFGVQHFKVSSNRWFRGYYALVSISLLVIGIVLWQNGWIAMRTWAM